MPRRRFIFLAVLGLALYLVVLLRLIHLQIFRRSYYAELSKKNYLRLRVLYPQRGDILDRNGEKIAY
ncbi:MAG: penicillin-binding protein 2, partial [Hydrogenobacter thermophilus]|nr:penicillin-binding protein 2 [Hydrogenobacter thermophilus]